MMTTVPREPAKLEVRDRRFDLSDVPRYWHGGQRGVSLFFDNLSLFFPPGERYFVAAVKAHRAQVKGTGALEAAVDGFCAQEGHHSREHARYNALLAQQGFDAQSLEDAAAKLLRLSARTAPKRRQLAVTCALEHFTALMGGLVIAHPELLDGAHPKMAALWQWHASEELEHKTVAFDVYRAVQGPWLERALTMAVVTVLFWSMVFWHQVRLMRADGILFSGREWWALGRYLFSPRWGLQHLLRPYLAYYRPSFHPAQIDDGPLIDRPQAGLAG